MTLSDKAEIGSPGTIQAVINALKEKQVIIGDSSESGSSSYLGNNTRHSAVVKYLIFSIYNSTALRGLPYRKFQESIVV